ncbi:MAG: SPOR domain-containing protein [Pseudomonadota bacterium]|nr:SPOR domain-containing protein [Pseudomonadota bacterium]
MAKKPKGSLLESLLRYEIILALFTLIGVYYFLTFSPVRMPRETITSPTIELPSPPPVTAKKPDTAVSRTTEIKPAPPVSVDNQKNHKISEAKPAEPTPRPPKVKAMEKKAVTPPIKKESAEVAPIEPEPTTTGTNKKAAAGQKPAKPERQQPPAAKPVENQTVQPARKKIEPVPAATIPETGSQKPAIVKQPTTIKQATMAKPSTVKKLAATPGKKSYVIQVGIFIFPETLKHYQHMLQDHGYASFVTTRKRLLPMHRVFLGPYPNLDRAKKTIRTINKWDDDPFPCRRGKQFYVNVGSFYYQTTAREKISQYRSRGFIPVDFHEPVKIPHHILLVDGFSFNHYPRSDLRSIKQLGIPDAFVRNWQP